MLNFVNNYSIIALFALLARIPTTCFHLVLVVNEIKSIIEITNPDPDSYRGLFLHKYLSRLGVNLNVVNSID